MIDALAKSYPVAMPGCTVKAVEIEPKCTMVRMQGVQYFIDSHHVGVFEGVLRYAGVQGDVKVRSFGPNDADLLCAWK
jgi:hypothetical protein